MIRAVLFDLDDTLYLQRDFLEGAWDAVAAAGAAAGADHEALGRALRAVAAEGSDRGQIIDRALASLGVEATVGPLVDAFRGYAPARLPVYPGAEEALARLRARVPVALVTDGDPRIQRAKLDALGLAGAFDAVVLSDTFGRQFRKPHARPFRAALQALDAEPGEAVMIGDRPDKDVAGALGAGMRPIRVYTGEYAAAPDLPAPWASAPDVVAAISLVEGALAGADAW